LTRVAAQFDARNRAFLQINRRLAPRDTDHLTEKFTQVRIVSHDKDGVVPAVLFHNGAKLRIGSGRSQRWLHLDFSVEAHLVPDQECGLSGALKRAGNNSFHLNVRGGKETPNQSALVDTLFVQAALLVLLGSAEGLAGAGVT